MPSASFWSNIRAAIRGGTIDKDSLGGTEPSFEVFEATLQNNAYGLRGSLNLRSDKSSRRTSQNMQVRAQTVKLTPFFLLLKKLSKS